MNSFVTTLIATCFVLLSLLNSALAQDKVSKLAGELPKIEGDRVTGLHCRNIPVRDLLLFYQKLAERPVICDNSVQGNLYLESEPVTKTEAKRLIEVTLLINGFSVVARERETLVLGPGKPTRGGSVPIYYTKNSIPDTEGIISYVFDLQYADPMELANTLNQYLAVGSPHTSFLPLPGAKQLLVTETTSTIRNLVPLIQYLDVDTYKRQQFREEGVTKLPAAAPGLPLKDSEALNPPRDRKRVSPE